ncbi:MAG: DnaJ domain-containing protein [Myxococcales bacterium]|nr:DnaJ domain-containing protein [Myxococcales bacterium]
MSDPLDALDYYTLLQIEQDASADAVRAAFHKFALRYHPDGYTMASEADKARVNQIYRRGGEAYRVLSNTGTRAAYDAGLAEGRLRHVAQAATDEASSRAQAVKRTVNAKARPFWAKAQAAIRDGQWGQAKLNLQIALGHDPDHPVLTERMAFVQSQR